MSCDCFIYMKSGILSIYLFLSQMPKIAKTRLGWNLRARHLNPSLWCGWQESHHLGHYPGFPRSALVGNWSQELDLGIKPKYCEWEISILTGNLISRLNVMPRNKNSSEEVNCTKGKELRPHKLGLRIIHLSFEQMGNFKYYLVFLFMDPPFPQSSKTYVEALTPYVSVFGHRAFKLVKTVKWG